MSSEEEELNIHKMPDSDPIKEILIIEPALHQSSEEISEDDNSSGGTFSGIPSHSSTLSEIEKPDEEDLKKTDPQLKEKISMKNENSAGHLLTQQKKTDPPSKCCILL